jgi:ankyrin repeat protein
MLDRIADGRTDLVLDHLAAGHPATATDAAGVRLIRWCAYYGDVSAVRLLLEHGETLGSLGENLDLNGAAFHGHWKLCEFLLERGADPNHALPDTGETPLHAAACSPRAAAAELVVAVLLAGGADPNRASRAAVETDCYMRDCRTRAETPLHRAAALGTDGTIVRLLEAGARRDARDGNGDTPLSWASWHRRPDAILRRLCYGRFSIPPDRQPMEASLRGTPRS